MLDDGTIFSHCACQSAVVRYGSISVLQPELTYKCSMLEVGKIQHELRGHEEERTGIGTFPMREMELESVIETGPGMNPRGKLSDGIKMKHNEKVATSRYVSFL